MVAAPREDARPLNEKEYVRDTVANLLNGITPAYNRLQAGIYAEIMDLIIDEYDSENPTEIEPFITALKNRYPQFGEVLDAEEDEENYHTDIVKGKKGKPVILTMSMDDIDQLPAIDWMIKKVIAQQTSSLFFAESGIGKTFEALDMALHLAYGLMWMGRKVKKCSVLYIYGEGRSGLKLRKMAWQKYHGQIHNNGKPFPNIPNFRAIARPVQLISDKALLIDTLEDMPYMPDLIIIDTFSVCAVEVDENSNPQVANALKTANDIRDKYGSHVMVIHHTGNENKEKWRGAAAFKGNVDTVMCLTRESETDPIFFRCIKQKDGAEPFAPIKLQLEQVSLGVDEDGEEITSCVIVSCDSATADEDRICRIQAHILRILEVEGQLKTSQLKTSAMKDREIGISRNEYYDNITALENAGKIEVVVNGIVVKGQSGIAQAKKSGKSVFYRLP